MAVLRLHRSRHFRLFHPVSIEVKSDRKKYAGLIIERMRDRIYPDDGCARTRSTGYREMINAGMRASTLSTDRWRPL